MFLFMVYFVLVIRSKNDKREILVPDISTAQVIMNTVPKSEELKFRRTTYLQHEMTQASRGVGVQDPARWGDSDNLSPLEGAAGVSSFSCPANKHAAAWHQDTCSPVCAPLVKRRCV